MMLTRGTLARLPYVSSLITRSIGGVARHFQCVRDPAATKRCLLYGSPASNGLSVAGFCSTRSIAQRIKSDLGPEYQQYRIDVPLRNNGHVALDILEPSGKSSRASNDGPNVIIYLPPGPAMLEDALISIRHGLNTHSPPAANPQLSLLQSAQPGSSTTVVTINYRLGPSEEELEPLVHTYPLPVHDMLIGFDWIFKNLRPKTVCIYGSHIGGSLALVLALTETRSVHRVAVKEPICDWVGLDDYCTSEKEKAALRSMMGISGEEGKREKGVQKSKAPPDLVPLLVAREVLFRKAANYFDAFASPLLFLRTAGKIPPLTIPSYDTGPDFPTPLLKPLSLEEEEYEKLLNKRNYRDIDPDEEYVTGGPEGERKLMKRPLRWPFFGMDSYFNNPAAILRKGSLTLPGIQFYITPNTYTDDGEIRDSSVLIDQTLEMVRVINIACFRGSEVEESKKVKIVNTAGPPMEEERPGMSVEQRAGSWFGHVVEDLGTGIRL